MLVVHGPCCSTPYPGGKVGLVSNGGISWFDGPTAAITPKSNCVIVLVEVVVDVEVVEV